METIIEFLERVVKGESARYIGTRDEKGELVKVRDADTGRVYLKGLNDFWDWVE